LKGKSPHAQPAIIVPALPWSQLIAESRALLITTHRDQSQPPSPWPPVKLTRRSSLWLRSRAC